MPDCYINLFQPSPNELVCFIHLNYYQQKFGGMGTKVPLFIFYLIPLPSSTGAVKACVVPPISALLGVGPRGAVWIVDSRQLSAAGPGLILHPDLCWRHRMRSFCSSFMLCQGSSPIVGFPYAAMTAQSCKEHPEDLACCLSFLSLVVLFLLFVDSLFSHCVYFFLQSCFAFVATWINPALYVGKCKLKFKGTLIPVFENAVSE